MSAWDLTARWVRVEDLCCTLEQADGAPEDATELARQALSDLRSECLLYQR